LDFRERDFWLPKTPKVFLKEKGIFFIPLGIGGFSRINLEGPFGVIIGRAGIFINYLLFGKKGSYS